MQIGRTQILKVSRHAEAGVYLSDAEGAEVLLPNRYVPTPCRVGDEVEVFVYTDGEDMKDLLLPFSEQNRELNEGDKVFVYVYEDSVTHRVVASAKWEKFLNKDVSGLKEGQKVALIVAGKTELGYKVVIDSQYRGLVFASDVFRPLFAGDRTDGYIEKIRPDGKIDVRLKRNGYESVSGEAETILEKLRKEGGFIPTTDKTEPEKIYAIFGMSKKTYKKAVGDLYKRHLITLTPIGIKIV